jgi:hypothetical protein
MWPAPTYEPVGDIESFVAIALLSRVFNCFSAGFISSAVFGPQLI